MNFQTMDYFVAIAEEKSFTKAGERLHVSQQTLSANVASVERELGVRLINRTVPLSLTYAGEEFLDYARRFQAEQRAMGQEFRDIAHDERGCLRVGVTSTRGHIIMPRAIAMFQRSHPGISFELYEGENDELVDLLEDGWLDMAVATIPRDEPGIVVRNLVREEVLMVVAESLLERLYGDAADEVVAEVERSESLKLLEGCPFLLVGERDVAGDAARKLLAEAGFRPDAHVRSSNSETLLALSLRGVGACFVPSELVATTFPDPESAGMRVIHLGEKMTYLLSVAWRDAERTWSMITAFGDVLVNQFSDGSRVSV
jgi:DNA-binding transcriptional LysR family regulator